MAYRLSARASSSTQSKKTRKDIKFAAATLPHSMGDAETAAVNFSRFLDDPKRHGKQIYLQQSKETGPSGHPRDFFSTDAISALPTSWANTFTDAGRLADNGQQRVVVFLAQLHRHEDPGVVKAAQALCKVVTADRYRTVQTKRGEEREPNPTRFFGGLSNTDELALAARNLKQAIERSPSQRPDFVEPAPTSKHPPLQSKKPQQRNVAVPQSFMPSGSTPAKGKPAANAPKAVQGVQDPAAHPRTWPKPVYCCAPHTRDPRFGRHSTMPEAAANAVYDYLKNGPKLTEGDVFYAQLGETGELYVGVHPSDAGSSRAVAKDEREDFADFLLDLAKASLKVSTDPEVRATAEKAARLAQASLDMGRGILVNPDTMNMFKVLAKVDPPRPQPKQEPLPVGRWDPKTQRTALSSQSISAFTRQMQAAGPGEELCAHWGSDDQLYISTRPAGDNYDGSNKLFGQLLISVLDFYRQNYTDPDTRLLAENTLKDYAKQQRQQQAVTVSPTLSKMLEVLEQRANAEALGRKATSGDY